MASGHVLRFPRSDKEGAFVIVQATQTRSKALDVKLVGTDGVDPYAVSLRHDKVASLRVNNGPCSEEEWLAILTAVFRQDSAGDIEVLASVQDESSITLTVRKKGKEFTQRLGAIELSHSPRELIELYDWCGLSVQTANEAKEALALATAKASQLEESVRELKAQLDELIEAKEADETELLEKFRDLLNEKKVKIRQQQRLLASANVEPERLTQKPKQEPSSQSSSAVHSAGKSSLLKRKARPAPAEETDSSDDGFEKMDVDLAMEPVPEESDQQHDTTQDEDETASDDGDDDEPVAPPPTKQAPYKPPSSQSKGKAKPAKKEEPPAKRDLPFNKRKQAQSTAPLPAAGSETDSDDAL